MRHVKGQVCQCDEDWLVTLLVLRRKGQISPTVERRTPTLPERETLDLLKTTWSNRLRDTILSTPFVKSYYQHYCLLALTGRLSRVPFLRPDLTTVD